MLKDMSLIPESTSLPLWQLPGTSIELEEIDLLMCIKIMCN